MAKEVKQALVDLRSTLAWLRSEGLLLESDVEADPDLDITGVQKNLDGSCPILFHHVRGYPHQKAVTNLFASTSVMNRMFGWADDRERTKMLARALTNPIKPVGGVFFHPLYGADWQYIHQNSHWTIAGIIGFGGEPGYKRCVVTLFDRGVYPNRKIRACSNSTYETTM